MTVSPFTQTKCRIALGVTAYDPTGNSRPAAVSNRSPDPIPNVPWRTTILSSVACQCGGLCSRPVTCPEGERRPGFRPVTL